MEYALPSTWGQGSRGFWTKRKKTATSLMAILALVAGIAVAFKLFDREVPNNVVRDASIFDFQVHVQRTASQGCNQPVQGGQWCDVLAGQDAIYAETEFVQGVERPVSTFPGDQRDETVRVINTNRRPEKDASFELYVKQDTITVRDCEGIDPETGECTSQTVVDPTDQRWTRFVNFWTFSVAATQTIVGFFGEEGYGPQPGGPTMCSGGLREITPNSSCELGTIRAAGEESDFPIGGGRLDARDYRFRMAEEDDGTDQSWAKGWTITFDFVFQARLPALPDPSGEFYTR